MSYDSRGLATKSEVGPPGSGIRQIEVTHHSIYSKTVKNTLGKEAVHSFEKINEQYKLVRIRGEESANCAAANQVYTYDDNAFVASVTDWNGNVTTYKRNSRGQELSRTEASGTPEARTITTIWHEKFNLPISIAEPERETVMTYNDQGRLLSREVRERH